MNQRINALADSLMEDYGRGRTIDEIKMFEYPDKDIVIDILEKNRVSVIIQTVVLPGIFPPALC